jgi:hippurate hydrolase
MGTFRAMNENWRFNAHELIKKTTTELVESMGGQATVHIDVGYPCVVNHDTLTQKAMEQANQLIGEKNVGETEIRMGAEDFGYYAQQIPACFFRLGTRNQEKGIIHGVHTSRFDIDEQALEQGVSLMAWLAISVDPQ